MSSVTVSMSEIRREGPWALRALGYPFGVADRATPLVVWTEAVHRLGLAWMRAGETRIALSASAPGAVRGGDPDTERTLDAGGRCLVEIGPPAVDLATLDVRRGGRGRIVVEHAQGLIFTGALCDLAARRGLGVIAVHASGTDEIGGERFASRGWIAARAGGPDPTFLAGTGNEDASRVTTWLAHAGLTADAATAGAIERDLVRLRSGNTSGGGWVALSLLGIVSEPAAPQPAGEPLPRTDWTERLRHAYRHGVLAKPADLRHLYALEERTWAPASDRSRRQAAF